MGLDTKIQAGGFFLNFQSFQLLLRISKFQKIEQIEIFFVLGLGTKILNFLNFLIFF